VMILMKMLSTRHETSEPVPIHEQPSTGYDSGTLHVAGDTNLFPELEEPSNKTGSDVFAVLDSFPDVTNVVGLPSENCDNVFKEPKELKMHSIGHQIDNALNLSAMDLESSLLLAMKHWN
jgi:hypothetical protein